MLLRDFQRLGVQVARFDDRNDDVRHERHLLRRAPYRSIYGDTEDSPFLYIDNVRQTEIRIECRWWQKREQDDHDDEEFPYLLMNARDAMPEKVVWLIIGGDGARPPAVAWLKREAEAEKAKTILVMTPEEAEMAVARLLQQ
jgi:hypothetical protein